MRSCGEKEGLSESWSAGCEYGGHCGQAWSPRAKVPHTTLLPTLLPMVLWARLMVIRINPLRTKDLSLFYSIPRELRQFLALENYSIVQKFHCPVLGEDLHFLVPLMAGLLLMARSGQ